MVIVFAIAIAIVIVIIIVIVVVIVTTRLDNAVTSTPGGYAITTDTRPCLCLNSVL